MTDTDRSPTGDLSTDRPAGRAAVRAALIEATIEALVERGPDVSVRSIAERARVNHGLIHTYFGGKDDLIRAALDMINDRAANELDDAGFPPPDLASHRNGELARVIARLHLDRIPDPFSSHPVIGGWREAIARSQPSLDDAEVDRAVAAAATIGLGWAVFGDQIAAALGADGEQRRALDDHIAALSAELGHIPRS